VNWKNMTFGKGQLQSAAESWARKLNTDENETNTIKLLEGEDTHEGHGAKGPSRRQPGIKAEETGARFISLQIVRRKDRTGFANLDDKCYPQMLLKDADHLV